MKKIILITKFILMLNLTSCQAQKLMQTQADAYKLVEQKELFVGKSLEFLLRQIKPPIKAYYASKWSAPYGALVFMFLPYDSVMMRDNYGKKALRIRVTVKEPFQWDNRLRKREDYYLWLKEDWLKYESLTVVDIGVSGNQ